MLVWVAQHIFGGQRAAQTLLFSSLPHSSVLFETGSPIGLELPHKLGLLASTLLGIHLAPPPVSPPLGLWVQDATSSFLFKHEFWGFELRSSHTRGKCFTN